MSILICLSHSPIMEAHVLLFRPSNRRVALSLALAFVFTLLLVRLALWPATSAPVSSAPMHDSDQQLIYDATASRIGNEDWSRRSGSIRTHVAAAQVVWDDVDSHKWIAEPWGDNIQIAWVEFGGRRTLRAVVTPSTNRWAVMRTDGFPAENWTTKTALRADVYQTGGTGGADIKLEVRRPSFDPPIQTIVCADITPSAWNTCAWSLSATPAYSAVAYLSIVFDGLTGADPITFYVDNLRLVDGSGEVEWDDMDDGSRRWFYFGNWLDWLPGHLFGLEPVSHNGDEPPTHTGAVYLQWNYAGGIYTGTTAEVGTQQLADMPDWSGFNRISADVRASDPDVPISVFLWDKDAITTPVDYRGFGTPTRKVGKSDAWQTLIWDLPWPPWFDPTGIDEIKFVVNQIDRHPTGTLYIDNIILISDTLPPAVAGLAYIFENFDDGESDFNDFGGNWGELNGNLIETSFVTDTHAVTGTSPGVMSASLKIQYSLPAMTFTGIWHSLWGHSAYTETRYIDFTDIYGDLNEAPKDFEQLRFWVRGSGATTGTHNIKVELKDNTGDFNRTAYRYIAVDDGDTQWREVVLDANVLNSSFWSYNLQAPDRKKMKQLVFVIESYFNQPSGVFYIDNIHFVDANDSPFNPAAQSDDAFLDFISKQTFLYFLDWYDPRTGLFQDRSTFPDLMSTAATGFGLTALTIGESRDWISRPLAIEMISRTLQTLHDGQSASSTVTDTITGTNGYKGFFYHFLGTDGLRKDKGSELSSVDTAILMAGILTAREHFNDAPRIVSLADQLYARVEWDWMLDSEDRFYLAWKPEITAGYGISAPAGGYFTSKIVTDSPGVTRTVPLDWDYYTDEVILIDLLAIGSPSSTHRVTPTVFYAWQRPEGSYAGYTLTHSWNGSLFTYFFAHLWIDFRHLGNDNHPIEALRVNWWDNSVKAATASWQFAVDQQGLYATYGDESWGLTAAEGPDRGYHAYGAPPAAITPTEHDGTIAPYGAGSAIMFVPELVTPTLRHFFSNTDLWRYRFGFGDAYNLDPLSRAGPWYNHAAFGIDQGPLLIAIENHRSGLVWKALGRNGSIRQALCLIRYCVYLPMITKNG